MAKFIGLSGSLRKGSYNTALLRAAAELMPDGSELSVRTIQGIPLYDADVEFADGIPATQRGHCHFGWTADRDAGVQPLAGLTQK